MGIVLKETNFPVGFIIVDSVIFHAISYLLTPPGNSVVFCGCYQIL